MIFSPQSWLTSVRGDLAEWKKWSALGMVACGITLFWYMFFFYPQKQRHVHLRREQASLMRRVAFSEAYAAAVKKPVALAEEHLLQRKEAQMLKSLQSGGMAVHLFDASNFVWKKIFGRAAYAITLEGTFDQLLQSLTPLEGSGEMQLLSCHIKRVNNGRLFLIMQGKIRSAEEGEHVYNA